MLVIYFALGLVVLASRLLFPRAKAADVGVAASAVCAANEQTGLAKAA